MTEDHQIIADAGRGRLPEWAEVNEARRRHLRSVARLLEQWAAALSLEEPDRTRWAAAGWLHDALRDADPTALAAEAGEYPEPLRHGPAVAVRLEREGVRDAELLQAIRYHTLGLPGLRTLGRFLYLADYLDPTRDFDGEERARLRDALPEAVAETLKTVCARRIAHLLDRGLPLRPETVGFWNEILEVG